MKDEAKIKDSIARKRIAEMELVIQNAQAEIREAEKDVIPTTGEILSVLTPQQRLIIELVYGIGTTKITQKAAAERVDLSMHYFREKLMYAERRLRREFGSDFDVTTLGKSNE